MATGSDHPVERFADRSAWAAWLDRHHDTAAGVWLRLARKGSAQPGLVYADAVEVALCYGWIDGQARRGDAETWLQKFTPRGRRSIWSKINRERAERLIASGDMQAPGLAVIAAARSDGRWDRAYDSPAVATVPEDLQAALDSSPAARAFFDTLEAGSRYRILFRVQTAVRPATRARRIERFIAQLERHEAP